METCTPDCMHGMNLIKCVAMDTKYKPSINNVWVVLGNELEDLILSLISYYNESFAPTGLESQTKA